MSLNKIIITATTTAWAEQQQECQPEPAARKYIKKRAFGYID